MIPLNRICVLVLLVCLLIAASTMARPEKRPRVKSVEYSGNEAYDDNRLSGLMLTRASKFLASVTYYPDVFRGDIETLMSFYRQNGYLQARIVDTVVTRDSVENQVRIAISVEEGVRTFVEGVTVFGNFFFNDSSLLKYVGIKANDPLRRPVIEDAVVAVLSLYAEHGFLNTSVTPRVQVNDSSHLALIDFVIAEGVSSNIKDIVISGANRTRPGVILRELSFQKGDTIRYSELIVSQRSLYLSGLFESVFVRPLADTGAETVKRDIVIEVREKPSSELSFSLGYGTIEKIRGRIDLSTTSLSGTARKAGVGLEANFIKQGVSMNFSEPWTFGTRWKSDLTVYGQLRQEPAYHAEVIGGKATVGRKLGAFTALSTSYRLENTNLSRVDLSTPVDELDPRIRSLSLNLSYDSRDNLFDPSSGWYAHWSAELAGSFLQGSNSFARSTVQLKRFKLIGRNTVVASALEVGWMDVIGGADDIPLSELYYTGGPTSLRGFGYQLVGPLDNEGEPRGGRFKLVVNLVEIRRALYKMIGGVLFFEFGNVWTQPGQIRLDDLRADMGAGIRINSPLGILRLDAGYNLDRRGDEPSIKIYFSMGQAF